MTRSECPVDADFQGVKHTAGRNEIHSCRQECQSCRRSPGRGATPGLAVGRLRRHSRIVFPHVAFSRFSLIPSPLPFLF